MLLTAPCIVVPATELSPDSASVRFFVIDCRPLDEYVRASLPTAVNLDLSAMSPEEVEKKVMSFKTGLAGQHLCIMGGDHSGPARVAVGILVAAKFGRISFMEQGFQACAELYEKGGYIHTYIHTHTHTQTRTQTHFMKAHVRSFQA
jgi:hypothetical protein